MASDEKIAAGVCPEHGAVAGDAVEFHFPNAATCALCGAELVRAGLATGAEIAEASRQFTRGETNGDA